MTQNWGGEMKEPKEEYEEMGKVGEIAEEEEKEEEEEEEEKTELKEKYKGEIPQQKIDKAFAKRVGRDFATIRKWKRELGLTEKRREYSTKEKGEIVEEFARLKKAFANEKCEGKRTAREIDAKIEKIIDFGIATIYLWKRELALTEKCPRKKYSSEDKMKIVQRYDKMKAETPYLRLKDIAKMLEVPERTLIAMRRELSTEQSPKAPKTKSVYLELGIRENKCVECGNHFRLLHSGNIKRHLLRHHKELYDKIETEREKMTKIGKMPTEDEADNANDSDGDAL
ncbi:hypothetical protein niasHT_024331 [Heterodera trifolii]|uniref:C2H2-type domain-containing protein n=1 Tax=Heterodera trifolii TaxID=157864 RepID=A0ABD2JMN6_9BILA